MKVAENNLRMLARVLCGPLRNCLNAQYLLPLSASSPDTRSECNKLTGL